jgi:hypothetical protein
VEGTLDGHNVRATMARRSVGDFPLMKRGFHWINEYPMNN